MDRRTVLAGLAGGIAVGSPFLAEAQARTPRRVAEGFAASLSAHDIDAFAALFDNGYVNHQLSAAAPPPPAGLTPKQATVGFFAARLKGIPDLAVAIEALVVGEDRCAASFVYTGTHQGVLLGVPATGKTLRFTSCDILRIAEGRIAEQWGMGDIAGVLAQIKS
jgi:ketosteroid isomerase-like protein